jgi:hypothetical protein
MLCPRGSSGIKLWLLRWQSYVMLGACRQYGNYRNFEPSVSVRNLTLKKLTVLPGDTYWSIHGRVFRIPGYWPVGSGNGQWPMIQAGQDRFDRAPPCWKAITWAYRRLVQRMLLQDRQRVSVAKGAIMQNGSLIRRARHSQSEVWEFRWRVRTNRYTAAASHRRWFNRPDCQRVRSTTSRRCPPNRNQPESEINPASNYGWRSRAAFPAARA